MVLLNNKIFKILPWLLIIAISFMYCSSNSSNKKYKNDIDGVNNFLNIENSKLISRDSLKAFEIKELKQNLISERSAKNLLKEEYDRFKSINSHVRTELITKIDSVFIPYEKRDTTIIYDDSYIGDFNLGDLWMSINGKVTTKGVFIDTLSFANKFDVTIGRKRSEKSFSFLRKKEYSVELISYSPYTRVNYLNNIVVNDDGKKNFIKPAIFIIGALAGGVLAFKLKK